MNLALYESITNELNSQSLLEINWGKTLATGLVAGSLLGIPNVSAAKPEVKVEQQIEENIVAIVLAGEAGGEGEIGMKAVACVIQNRMKKSGKTAKQIVTARKQFSAYEDKALMKRNYAQVKEVADKIVSKIGSLEDITGGATNYVVKWLYEKKKDDPKHWISKMKITKIIGNHVFMKE